MSARYLRKVLKEQEAANQPDEPESEPDSDSEPPARAVINPFDLLNQEEDEDEDEHDQENESGLTDESSTVNSKDNGLSTQKTSVMKVSSANNQKSKKKKKKKSKDSSSGVKQSANSLDVILEELSVGPNSRSEDQSSKVQPSNANARGCKPFTLQVDPKYLNADNELRRIFGSKVVDSVERTRGARRGGHSHRKTILVTPSDHWPRWDGSLSMKLLDRRDGYNNFIYEHSSTYIHAQKAFESAKAIHDLNSIAQILLHYPYHVDSLITLAEYFKFSGEHQMSADAIAKCLYALECAWHPMFTPLQGNCQLKYNHETNKPLFSVLFTHMKNMDRRGCHRCALEICKLLLSLDSDDPMGALFCIDYFSLRAGEYTWLEQFSEEYNSDNSLWLFPNFSFSLAICRFYLEREEDSKAAKMERGKGKATSSDLMKQALMLHPTVLKKLVAKVPLKDQAWTKILKHNFFGSSRSGSPSLDHLIDIYVERSYIIWRLPDLHNFLKDTAFLVIEKHEDSDSEAKDWACLRKEVFSPDKNEYSHLMVSDFSDSVPTMPPELLQNFMADPRMMGAQQAEQVNPPIDAHAPRDVANRNPLAVLLESMLPWVNYGTREDVPGED